VAREAPSVRIVLTAAIAAVVLVLVLVLVPSARAGNGGGRCTRNAPGISVDNTWGRGKTGSWGLPGQQLKYAIRVTNYDVYCSSSSFVVSVSASSGFSVSIPTNTVTLKSTTSGYLWAYVTSAAVSADGDYPLTLTVERAGASSPTVSTSYYRVYSSDAVAPALFWSNPGAGEVISGGSYTFAVWSNDDHEVRKIDLYIDNVYTATTLCEDISYNCQGYYPLSLRVSGQHTATFESYDWIGNVGVLTVPFTVS